MANLTLLHLLLRITLTLGSQVHPLRISKNTPTPSPKKTMASPLPRPLSEISPTEKRRNSPSWQPYSPKVRYMPMPIPPPKPQPPGHLPLLQLSLLFMRPVVASRLWHLNDVLCFPTGSRGFVHLVSHRTVSPVSINFLTSSSLISNTCDIEVCAARQRLFTIPVLTAGVFHFTKTLLAESQL